VIFHLGIRPEEILLIRLSMVDMDKKHNYLNPKTLKQKKIDYTNKQILKSI
jgi:hypothetical protein